MDGANISNVVSNGVRILKSTNSKDNVVSALRDAPQVASSKSVSVATRSNVQSARSASHRQAPRSGHKVDIKA